MSYPQQYGAPPAGPDNGLGTASMILGIIGLPRRHWAGPVYVELAIANGTRPGPDTVRNGRLLRRAEPGICARCRAAVV